VFLFMCLDDNLRRIPDGLGKCTSVRSPYMPGLLCYRMEFKDGPVSYSEAFDPDDLTRMDRYPKCNIDKQLGDRPPTPTQQREEQHKLKASRNKSNLSAIPD
jgi:hypothetical protein